MNTRASRTIVTQSVPKVSSSAEGFARTTAAWAHAGINPAVCIPTRTGLVRARGDISFEWVKGHNGDRWNDRADELAVEACQRQEELSG